MWTNIDTQRSWTQVRIMSISDDPATKWLSFQLLTMYVWGLGKIGNSRNMHIILYVDTNVVQISQCPNS